MSEAYIRQFDAVRIISACEVNSHFYVYTNAWLFGEATVRSSKSRFAIDEYIYGTCNSYWACTTKVIAMAMTFDGSKIKFQARIRQQSGL